MSAYLDEEYFIWLYSQIGNVSSKNPARTHWKLAKQLYTKEFIWLVPNDDNRKHDGIYMRHEFLESQHLPDTEDPPWMEMGCSMLEMLIALSRRLGFQTDDDPRAWFWELIENLGIGMAWSADKRYTEAKAQFVDDAIDRVIWRTYEPSGQGGLFPLPEATEDQRGVELWYQLGAYLIADMAL